MSNPWEPKEYSEETARKIDDAVSRLIGEAHQRALTTLRENRATLDAIAEALVREESLDREQITSIVNEYRRPGQEPFSVPTGEPTPEATEPAGIIGRE